MRCKRPAPQPVQSQPAPASPEGRSATDTAKPPLHKKKSAVRALDMDKIPEHVSSSSDEDTAKGTVCCVRRGGSPPRKRTRLDESSPPPPLDLNDTREPSVDAKDLYFKMLHEDSKGGKEPALEDSKGGKEPVEPAPEDSMGGKEPVPEDFVLVDSMMDCEDLCDMQCMGQENDTQAKKPEPPIAGHCRRLIGSARKFLHEETMPLQGSSLFNTPSSSLSRAKSFAISGILSPVEPAPTPETAKKNASKKTPVKCSMSQADVFGDSSDEDSV